MAAGQRRVLIVDDSRFVRTTFNRILSASFAVVEEADGEAAWHKLTTDGSINMVFSDLDMPKLDGFALIERIRQSADPRLARLPVVVISGAENEATKKRALEVGANDFISKNADAPEVLARIDNLMRLVSTERTATHDPLTGTLTPHYLQVEGGKRFSYARRHNEQLSVMALRIESHAELAVSVSREVADQILVRIARLVTTMSRAEDTVGRAADSTFVVISAGTGAPQVLAFARRLSEQLENAKVSYGGQLLKIRTSYGVASLGVDNASSIDDLMMFALQRLQKAANQAAAPQPAARPALPPEVDKAIQVLEKLDPARLGDAAAEILRRLSPFLQEAFRRAQEAAKGKKAAR
jgi:two-component system cell cycle response regulator